MLDAHTNLNWNISPLEALQRWPSELPVALLHSGRLHEKWSRYSILAAPDSAFRFCMTGKNSGKSEWIVNESSSIYQLSNNPLDDLNSFIKNDEQSLWIGYIGYDIARFIEQLPYHAKQDRSFPLLQFQRCSTWLLHDSLTDKWSAGGAWPHPKLADLPNLPKHNTTFKATDPKPLRPRQDHERSVQKAIDYIAAGDIFQVNLAQRFTCEFSGNTRSLFTSLAGISPAWYGGYMELLKKDYEQKQTIASTSPELFLSIDETGTVTTRPIKGTSPSGISPAKLEQSEKDAAELNMIVDLLRNDLGRVCQFGSVKVTQPRTIETHPTVHHGVATVTGKLRSGATIADLLKATMPGGSITGAPKVRAMEIIEELEPVRRGPYCGALGYFYKGAGQLNILIRTLLAQIDEEPTNIGKVDFSVGGGIVADSTPEGEYQETLDKATALIKALSIVN